jgi:hypothetical protein
MVKAIELEREQARRGGWEGGDEEEEEHGDDEREDEVGEEQGEEEGVGEGEEGYSSDGGSADRSRNAPPLSLVAQAQVQAQVQQRNTDDDVEEFRLSP